MSLQTKPLVVKEISSLSLGYASTLGRNSFANLGLGLQRYISDKELPTFASNSIGRVGNTVLKKVWGLGELEYPGMVKVCLMTGPKLKDPDERDSVDNQLDKSKLHGFISKKFPRVCPVPSIEESCIYTVRLFPTKC